MGSVVQMPAPACPVLDHLTCKLPGELEPRIYDVYATVLSLTAGSFFPQQFVDIGNRDAPWHFASFGQAQLSGGGALKIRLYNSRGFAAADNLNYSGNIGGGQNAAFPFMPSLVWPVNSSLMFDVQNTGNATGSWALFFYGFKVYDRGKAPC